MKGLCAGLGEEKGLALGDLGDGSGNSKGGGMEKEDLAADIVPKLDNGAGAGGGAVLTVGPNEKGFLDVLLLAIAEANGLVFAYAENPPGNIKHYK